MSPPVVCLRHLLASTDQVPNRLNIVAAHSALVIATILQHCCTVVVRCQGILLRSTHIPFSGLIQTIYIYIYIYISCIIEPKVRSSMKYTRILIERKTLLIFILNRFRNDQFPSSAYKLTSCYNKNFTILIQVRCYYVHIFSFLFVFKNYTFSHQSKKQNKNSPQTTTWHTLNDL